jgi:hypothetical protein
MSFEVEEDDVTDGRLSKNHQANENEINIQVTPTLNEEVVEGDETSSNSPTNCLSILFEDPNLLDLKTDEDNLEPVSPTPARVEQQIIPKSILRACIITPKSVSIANYYICVDNYFSVKHFLF